MAVGAITCQPKQASKASEAHKFDRDPSMLSVAIVTIGLIWFAVVVVIGVVMPVLLIVERLIRYFK